MSNIPEPAKEILRREVGFGCPVCRSPFLTFHHFDPPTHVEPHNRPEGMIALCLDCHGDADDRGNLPGNYSIGELRAMKRKSYSSKSAKGFFHSWQDKFPLVRFAGVYTDISSPIIAVNRIPQITLTKNEANVLCLSFQLMDKDGVVLASMTNNCFEVYPARIQDMIVTPKTKDVKIWLAKDDVGLELTFDRISIEQLHAKLAQDQKRDSEQNVFQVEASHPLSGTQRTRTIMDWTRRNCLMDDGMVPLLDFHDVALNYPHGGRVEVRRGIAYVIHYGAEFDTPEGISAININCHCSICEPRR